MHSCKPSGATAGYHPTGLIHAMNSCWRPDPTPPRCQKELNLGGTKGCAGLNSAALVPAFYARKIGQSMHNIVHPAYPRTESEACAKFFSLSSTRLWLEEQICHGKKLTATVP